MTQQEQTISMLFKALREIEQTGTHYPPHWEKYTEEQKLKFPPHRTKEAKIAFDALIKVTEDIAP
jgi:hypothetical protein